MKNLNTHQIDSSMPFKQNHFSKKKPKSHKPILDENWDSEDDEHNFNRIVEAISNTRRNFPVNEEN